MLEMKRLDVFKKALLFFIPAVLAAGVLLVLIYSTEVENEKRIIEFDESLLLKLDSRIIRSEMKQIASDVKFFSSDKNLPEAIKRENTDLRRTLKAAFLNFIKEQGRYSQIRLIDTDGRVVVQVDVKEDSASPETIEALQSVTGRDYFQETIGLDPGKIYISSFDPRREPGQTLDQIKLTIHVGIPVSDGEGKKQGILVFDYLGEILLNQLYQIRIDKAEKHMLINSEGYWINSSLSERDWRLVAPSQKEQTFVREYPDAWRKIQGENSGFFYTSSGLFSFTTTNPSLVGSNRRIDRAGKVQSPNRKTGSWKLISFVSADVLTEKPKETLKNHFILIALYCGIVALGSVSLAFALLKREMTTKALQERDDRIRNIVETAPDGIVAFNQNGIVESINPEGLRIFGYVPGEIKGRRIDMLIPEFYQNDDDSKKEEDPETELRCKVGVEHEFVGRHKDETFFPLEITLSEGQHDGKYFYTGIVRDISKRKQMEEKILHDALYDSLTNLPNRSLLLDRMSRCIHHSKQRADYLFAVLFMDIDRFKDVNDSLGHMVGDQLLIEVSERLGNCVRSRDTIARLGGDEVAVLLEDITDIGDATFIANRILASFEVPFHLKGNELFSSMSIGIALSATGYQTPEEILRDADIAMYRAKKNGRAQYEIFDLSMRAIILKRQKMEKDLRSAVESDELDLYYQPIISLETGQLVNFEALVRWNHPEEGLISPEKFIHIAEESGLIVSIGQFVFKKACRQMSRWKGLYPSYCHIGMSVNFSGKQLLYPKLIQEIEEILEETQCDANYMKVEVTETLLMEDVESIQKVLLALKRMNFQLYIDDFGTGYSSLSYLHQFPFDALKIDRSFTSKMCDDETTLKIIKTIISLAEELGMHVITEGIETLEQLDALKGLHSKYGQGYYFSRPVDEKSAGILIEQDVEKRYATEAEEDMEITKVHHPAVHT